MAEQFPSGLTDFQAGSQIGSYELAEEVGRGGMAVVYRARDVRLDRWVALKVLTPSCARDEAFRQRFIRESRTAAAVDHPNIIPIFDAGEADGVLYIAMRYAGGQDVHSLLHRSGPLPAPRALGIITQVAAALDAAHACGLVHRDVKPANMLLDGPAGSGTDHIYLSDFGISKATQATTSLTLTGQVLGTLNYLAPEQVEGRVVDGRADGYALACAAFEMLAGAPPFHRDENLAVMWAQVSAPPPPLTGHRPDLPQAADRVMARALAKAPADRYQTCRAFAAALAEACRAAPPTRPNGTVVAGPARGGAPPTVADGPALPGAAVPPADAAGSAAAASPVPPGGPARPVTSPLALPPRSALGRRRPRGLVIALACVLAVLVAGGGWALSQRGSLLGPGGAGGAPPPTASVPARPLSPEGTVRAYYRAITRRDYRLAWQLGGRTADPGGTEPDFAAGFHSTQRDEITSIHAVGSAVQATFSAVQTDGTVKRFAGSYLVKDGVIVRFKVTQVS